MKFFKSLVFQILLGLILGILTGYFFKDFSLNIKFLGDWFIKALKAIAPILVFIMILSAIIRFKSEDKKSFSSIIGLYIVSTLAASFTAVFFSQLFPAELTLTTDGVANLENAGAQSVWQVLGNVISGIITDPVTAVINANFLSLVFWAVSIGLALRQASSATKEVISNLSHAFTSIVKYIIRLAPLGVFGLIAYTVANTGFKVLADYTQIILLLLGSMAFIAFIVNPLLVFIMARKNPYPLIFKVLVRSGIPAFMTRSSAANVPVNLELCEQLQLPKSTYSVSIPMGATVNMAGAAITITVMTLAAVHTLNIQADIYTMLLLSVISAVCACGASGIAGGSLMLIPLSCSLFGIQPDISMQVIAATMIIGVIQDSAETALNSSSDVILTAAASMRQERLSGKQTTS